MPSYTAQRIVDRSLLTLGVLESEESATSAMLDDALDHLMDLLNELEMRGLGALTTDLVAASELALDPDEYRFLRLGLALDLAPDYQVADVQLIAAQYDNAKRLMDAKYSDPCAVCLDPAIVYAGGRYNITTDN